MKRYAALLLIVSILLITGCGQRANGEVIKTEEEKAADAADDGSLSASCEACIQQD